MAQENIQVGDSARRKAVLIGKVHSSYELITSLLPVKGVRTTRESVSYTERHEGTRELTC